MAAQITFNDGNPTVLCAGWASQQMTS